LDVNITTVLFYQTFTIYSTFSTKKNSFFYIFRSNCQIPKEASSNRVRDQRMQNYSRARFMQLRWALYLSDQSGDRCVQAGLCRHDSGRICSCPQSRARRRRMCGVLKPRRYRYAPKQRRRYRSNQWYRLNSGQSCEYTGSRRLRMGH